MTPKATRTRKTQGPRRLIRVNKVKIEHKFLVVLNREANQMLDKSYLQKLSEEEGKELINYLKLLKELQKSEKEELENMSDDELKALAGLNKGE